MKKNKAIITTAALIATLGVTLAACSTDSEATPAPTAPAATQSAEPTAPADTPAPEAPAEPAVELPDVYFPGADIRIPIDPALPIQEDVIEAVRAETTANAEAIIATNPASSGVPTDEQLVAINSAKSEVNNLTANLSEATGRTVFVVFQAWASVEGYEFEMMWGAMSKGIATGVAPSTDKDAVVAAITAWVAAQPDPSAYEIIIT